MVKKDRAQLGEHFITVVKAVGGGAHILVDKSLIGKTVEVTIKVVES